MGRRDDDSEGTLHVLVGIAPIFPDTGSAEWLVVAARNRAIFSSFSANELNNSASIGFCAHFTVRTKSLSLNVSLLVRQRARNNKYLAHEPRQLGL
jgi:hypothetical protein